MSRIPRELARRIDRLARRAHAFHRLAHHPLCAAYDPEVIHLGRRRRVCRGCAAAVAGTAAGLLGGLLAPRPPSTLLAAGLAAFAVGLLWALRGGGAGHRHQHRPPKAFTRLAPMLLGGAVFSAGMSSTSPAGLAAAAGSAALVSAAVVAYRRRGPDRSACAGCHERDGARTCSGFAPMARSERAFQRLAARWIAAADGARSARRAAPVRIRQ